LAGDCFNLEHFQNQDKQKKAIQDFVYKINNEGAWRIVGEDWKNSGYYFDIMENCVKYYETLGDFFI